MPDDRIIQLEVGTDASSRQTFPAFSNFLQVSRVATEVQFEFLFVDINQLALTLQKAKESPTDEPPKMVGMTVSKVVLPALNFIQMRDHINKIFEAIEKELGKLPQAKEAEHGSGHVVSTEVPTRK